MLDAAVRGEGFRAGAAVTVPVASEAAQLGLGVDEESRGRDDAFSTPHAR